MTLARLARPRVRRRTAQGRCAEAVLHVDRRLARRQLESARCRAVEIVRLDRAARARSKPSSACIHALVRRMRTAVAAHARIRAPAPCDPARRGSRSSRRAWGSRCLRRFATTGVRATDRVQDEQLGVAALVADVGDPLAVRRPARVAPIEVAERQRQWRGAVGRREPELVPLPPVVARDTATCAAVRAQAPAGRSSDVSSLSTRATIAAGRRPRPTRCRRCPRRSRVADEVDALAVRRPRRVDRVIVLPNSSSGRSCSGAGATRALRSGGRRGRVSAIIRLKCPLPPRRDPGELPAIRRQPRLDVDRAVSRSARCSRPLARSSRHSSSALPS